MAGQPVPYPGGAFNILSDADQFVGGLPDDLNDTIVFSTPNLIYDMIGDMSGHAAQGVGLNFVTEKQGPNDASDLPPFQKSLMTPKTQMLRQLNQWVFLTKPN